MQPLMRQPFELAAVEAGAAECFQAVAVGPFDGPKNIRAVPRAADRDEQVARRLLELVPMVPTLIWGRDERGTGDMWNCNSVTSWLLSRSGMDIARTQPPPNVARFLPLGGKGSRTTPVLPTNSAEDPQKKTLFQCQGTSTVTQVLV